MTLGATSQGAVLVNCHFTAAEGFDPSISPPSCGILCDVFKIFKMASQSWVQPGMKESSKDPPGEILSFSFYHVINHPKTWWFTTITTYLASDSVDWQFWLDSAVVPQVSVVTCGLDS